MENVFSFNIEDIKDPPKGVSTTHTITIDFSKGNKYQEEQFRKFVESGKRCFIDLETGEIIDL